MLDKESIVQTGHFIYVQELLLDYFIRIFFFYVFIIEYTVNMVLMSVFIHVKWMDAVEENALSLMSCLKCKKIKNPVIKIVMILMLI